MGIFPYEQRLELAKPTPKATAPDFANRHFTPLFTSHAIGSSSKIYLTYQRYPAETVYIIYLFFNRVVDRLAWASARVTIQSYAP
jgi:hypothetical protein